MHFVVVVVFVFGMQEEKVHSVQVGSKSRALSLPVKLACKSARLTRHLLARHLNMHIQKYR